MRTLLHLFPTFALGGAQRRFAQVARAARGWRHVIVALDGDTAADAALGDVDRTYETLALRSAKGVSPSNLRALQSLCRRVRPTLVATYNWGAIEGVLANRLGPRLPHLHHEDGFGADEAAGEAPRRRVMRRLALSRGVHVLVPSTGLADRASHAWGVPEKRLRFVPNGVDLEAFSPGRDGRGPAVYLGALRPEKNLPRLLAAMAGVPFALDVWGDGGVALDPPANVRLRGGTDAPQTVLRGARLLALSSDTEQMPLVVLEAMAAGLPVVATDVGDTKRLVAEPNRRFVTPLGDEAAFAEALRAVGEDDALAARLGAANRARAEAAYGLDRMTSAHTALWNELAA